MTEPTQTQNAGSVAASDSVTVTGTPATASAVMAATTHNLVLSGTATDGARIAAEHGLELTGSLDFEVLRGILAAIGYDIPRDRFESAVFLATSDTKAHG
ncbi:hypothetical protein NOH83_001374 [Salmonella enterica]|nr:hypothetical protein [Salmonella enterica]